MAETTWYPCLECRLGEGSSETYQVLGFSGHEALGEPYEYEVLLQVQELGALNGHPEAHLDQRVTLSWAKLDAGDSGERLSGIHRHGFLVSVQEEASTGSGTCFRVRLKSSLWKLGRNPASRVFTSMNLKDQIKTLMDNKVPFDLTALPEAPATPATPATPEGSEGSGAGTVKPGAVTPEGGAAPPEVKVVDWERPYRIQYEETDLDFLHRHCERCGISYRILQDGSEGPETVQFLDGGGQPGECASVSYSTQSGTTGERLWSFSKQTSSLPAKLRLRAYVLGNPSDFNDVEWDLRASSRRDGEVYAIEGGFCENKEEAKALAKVRAEALECEADTWIGEGCLTSLEVGDCFTLKGHPRKEKVDGIAFRIVRMEIQMGNNGGKAGSPPEGVVTRLEAVPASRPYRPPLRTTVPRIAGPLLAQVALPDDKKTTPPSAEVAAQDQPAQQVEQPTPRYAEVDAKGRCKVALSFGQSKKDDNGTVLRLPQLSPFGGHGHGLSFPLHPGADVLVVALNGDPDALAIAAALPTDRCASQVDENSRSQKRLKTPGNNQLYFSDVEGRECIGLSSPAGGSGFILGERRGAGPGCLVWSDGEGGRFLKGGSVDVVQGSSRVYRQGAENATYLGGREELALVSSQACTLGMRTDLRFGGHLSLGAGFHLDHWEGSTLNLASREMRFAVGDFLEGPLGKVAWLSLPSTGLALALLSSVVGGVERGKASSYWSASFPDAEGRVPDHRPLMAGWIEPLLIQGSQAVLAAGLARQLSAACAPPMAKRSEVKLGQESVTISAPKVFERADLISLFSKQTEVLSKEIHLGSQAGAKAKSAAEKIHLSATTEIELGILEAGNPAPNHPTAGLLLLPQGAAVCARDAKKQLLSEVDVEPDRIWTRSREVATDAGLYDLRGNTTRIWSNWIYIGTSSRMDDGVRSSTVEVSAGNAVSIGVLKAARAVPVAAPPRGRRGSAGQVGGSLWDAKEDLFTRVTNQDVRELGVFDDGFEIYESGILFRPSGMYLVGKRFIVG